jgi:hypothetical protein
MDNDPDCVRRLRMLVADGDLPVKSLDPAELSAMVREVLREYDRRRDSAAVIDALNDLVPLASRAYRVTVGGIERIDAPVTMHAGGTDAPRLVLMRYLMTDDPTPWQMCVDINDDDSVVLGKDRATPSEALASVREHLDSASELPPVRWGDYGTMDGDAGLFGDGEDDDA